MSSNKLEAKSLKFADLQDYWRGKLAKLPALKLPLDYPRPPFPSYLRSRETLDLDGQLLSEIKRFCDKENLHLFTFLLLA